MIKVKFIASGSKGNSCFLDCDGVGVLVDVGVSPKVIRNAIDLTKINMIFLTHEHKDHSLHAVELANKLQVPIISGLKTHEVVSKELLPYLKVNVKANKQYSIKGIQLVPFGLHHDVPTLGFYLKSSTGTTLAFISDTGNVRGLKLDADVYLLEMSYNFDYAMKMFDCGRIAPQHYYRLLGDDGHLSMKQAKEFIENETPKNSKIYLHHLGLTGDLSEIIKIKGRKIIPVLVNKAGIAKM